MSFWKLCLMGQSDPLISVIHLTLCPVIYALFWSRDHNKLTDNSKVKGRFDGSPKP